MRRGELTALGVNLPVLATICPVALPEADWPRRMERAGLDVISTGLSRDTGQSSRAASEQVPYRPTLGLADTVADALAIVASGCRIVRTDAEVDLADGCYRYGPSEAAITFNHPVAAVLVARRVLHEAQNGQPSALWVAAGSGFSDLDVDSAEEGLRALADGAVQARLWLAKEQFDR